MPTLSRFQVHENNYKYKLLDRATRLKGRLNKYGAKWHCTLLGNLVNL